MAGKKEGVKRKGPAVAVDDCLTPCAKNIPPKREEGRGEKVRETTRFLSLQIAVAVEKKGGEEKVGQSGARTVPSTASPLRAIQKKKKKKKERGGRRKEGGQYRLGAIAFSSAREEGEEREGGARVGDRLPAGRSHVHFRPTGRQRIEIEKREGREKGGARASDDSITPRVGFPRQPKKKKGREKKKRSVLASLRPFSNLYTT